MLQPGSKVGSYTVEELIADGDLAATWRVSGPRGERLAMRVLVIRDRGFAERLRRASEAQRGLVHGNLVKVVDVVDADGDPAVITEFVEGVDLERWILLGQQPSGRGGRDLGGPAEVLLLFRQMVDGVRAAHGAGLLHRNLKPGKVLITRDADGLPLVKISDFLLGKVRLDSSAAALTQMGTTFGTPQYMSPEQFRGASTVDERTDLWSLGCLLYEMATGRRAFDGKNVVDVYKAVAGGSYTPVDEARPGLPPWVGQIVDQCLQTDLNKRLRSAEDLHRKLLGVDFVPAFTPTPVPRSEGRVSEALHPITRSETRVERAPQRPTLSGDAASRLPRSSEPPTATILLVSLALGLGVGSLVMVFAAIAAYWVIQS